MKTFTITADGAAQDVVNGVSEDVRTWGLRWWQIGCCTFQAVITVYHTDTNDNDPRTRTITIGQKDNQYGSGNASGLLRFIPACSNSCAQLRRVTRVTIEPIGLNGCDSIENTYKLCMCFCSNQTSSSGFPSDTATCDAGTCSGKYVAA